MESRSLWNNVNILRIWSHVRVTSARLHILISVEHILISVEWFSCFLLAQIQLYEDFARSRARQDAQRSLNTAEVAKPHSHVFQSLQYLRKVCNHPLLVLHQDHPLYQQVVTQLERASTSLHGLQVRSENLLCAQSADFLWCRRSQVTALWFLN